MEIVMAFAHLVSLSHYVRGSPGVASLLRICMRFDSGCRHQQNQPVGERGGGGGKDASFACREILLATVPIIFGMSGGIISGASGEPSPSENRMTK